MIRKVEKFLKKYHLIIMLIMFVSIAILVVENFEHRKRMDRLVFFTLRIQEDRAELKETLSIRNLENASLIREIELIKKDKHPVVYPFGVGEE